MVIDTVCTNGMLNCNDTIGQVVMEIATQTTGSLFLTLLFVVLIILALATLFGIKLEYTTIIILPLIFGLMAATQDFIGLVFILLIYLAIILAGHFILK